MENNQKKILKIFLSLFFLFFVYYFFYFSKSNLIHDVSPEFNNGIVKVVVEISAGSDQKWEVSKKTGELEWDIKNGKKRKINYIPYPFNYGMIPQTLVSKESGGDGDPLDIIILGPSIEKGSKVLIKVIGALRMLDNKERDDKIIAVSNDTLLYNSDSIHSLDARFPGIKIIIETWFMNYKGKNKIEVQGFYDKEFAVKMIQKSIDDYLKDRVINMK